jgi:hypothetical protein
MFWDSIPPSSAEVKNGGGISSLPNTSSWHGAWLIKSRDTFTITFVFRDSRRETKELCAEWQHDITLQRTGPHQSVLSRAMSVARSFPWKPNAKLISFSFDSIRSWQQWTAMFQSVLQVASRNYSVDVGRKSTSSLLLLLLSSSSSSNSNKLENIQRMFANLCYNRFVQSNCSRNYEFMLNYLHLKTLYSRRQHLDALFLVYVFKNKINCCSIMDTVGLHIPAKQIRDFSTFRVKNVSRLSPSARRVIAANSICRSLDIFNKNRIFLKDTFSTRSWRQLDCFIICYLNLDFM